MNNSSCIVNGGGIRGNGANPNHIVNPSFFLGGIRNTYSNLRIQCAVIEDNTGPGLSAFGGMTDMSPPTLINPEGRNIIANNWAHPEWQRTQIYFS